MNYEGSVTIPAERGTVWKTVRDPEVLTACVTGAEEIEQVSDREYEGVIRQTVAGVSVEMDGNLQIEEWDAPRWLRFTGVGSDTHTGSRMEVDADVKITDGEDGSTLSYDVEVTFTGKLASLGSRVLRRQIQSNIDAYFDNLADHVSDTQ
ncbi:MAG: CoxG family protein [Halodesulfurarchaeum sp.]